MQMYSTELRSIKNDDLFITIGFQRIIYLYASKPQHQHLENSEIRHLLSVSAL